jgi:hypothetical protein
MLAQSNTIARYVAREVGSTGNNNWEAAQCDQLVDAVMDVFQLYVVWKFV